MTNAKPSRILKEIHEGAKGLYKLGFIDLKRMREYDTMLLPEVKAFPPSRIRSLRKRHSLSQAVLAKFLNASLSTVRQWEIGAKKPAGTSLKLLDLLDRKGLEVLV
jgi:putative transcriptional regulator